MSGEPGLNIPPKIGKILAWVGIVSTLLGIVGFFISDLPALFGNDATQQGLTEEEIVATLAALRDGKEGAELQLTQIALEEERSANQATQDALAQREADSQATLNAYATEAEAFSATQNAIAAVNATATQTVLDVTATQEAVNATATQDTLNVTATAQFLAQITPSPTTTYTPTPRPTATPTPQPVTDYRRLTFVDMQYVSPVKLQISARTNQAIPQPPPDTLSYVWSLDTDRDPETGLALQGIGVDMRVVIRYENSAWIGTVRVVKDDGTLGEPFIFADLNVEGDQIQATLNANQLGLPDSFNWVARVELKSVAYSILPDTGFYTVSP